MKSDGKTTMSRLVMLSTLLFVFGVFNTASTLDVSGEPVLKASETKSSAKTGDHGDYKLSASDASIDETKVDLKLSADKTALISMFKLNLPGQTISAKWLDVSGLPDTTVPGTYTVNFTYYGIYKTSAKLTVNPLDAKVTTTKTTTSIPVGSSIADLKAEFGVKAWEFDSSANGGKGDLYSSVVVTGTPDYNSAGSYNVRFGVKDSDSSSISDYKDVTIVVTDITPVIETEPMSFSIIEESEVLTDASVLAKSGLVAKYSDGTTIPNANIQVSVGNSTSNGKPYDNGTTPGVYPVTVSIKNKSGSEGLTRQFNITVTAVEPTIMASNKNYFVPVGTPLPDLATLKSWFGISGYEFSGMDNGYTFSYEFINGQGYKNDHPTNNPIRFTITDNDGQSDSVEVNLHIKKKGFEPGTDPVPPTISVNTKVSSPEGKELTDAQLIALFAPMVTDDEGGNYTIEVMHSVNWTLAQEYTITFKVTDANGLTATTTGILDLTDKLPSISFEYNPVYYVQGDPVPNWKEAFGISATELENGDLTSSVKVYGPSNLQNLGTHYVTFKVKDNEGNWATKVLKVITTAPYNHEPTITGTDYIEIPEDNGVALTKAQLLAMFDVTAIDFEDGMLANDKITITGAPNDLHHPGVYTIHFTAMDSKGATVYFKAILRITDVKPTMKRKFIESYTSKNVPITDYIKEYGIKATEFTKGDLNSAIVISFEEYTEMGLTPIEAIDYSRDGYYRITFTATDEEGNSVFKRAYLQVGYDEYPEIIFEANPEITIPEEMSLSVKDLINKFEPMILLDGKDFSELLDQVGLSGTYDLTKPSNPGDPYQLTLTLTFNDEEFMIPVLLNITDIMPTIKADNSLVTIKDTDKLTKEKLLEMFGLTASEINDNDLFDRINVDWSEVVSKGGKFMPGTYPVVFTVTDDEGNEVSTTTNVEVTSASTDDGTDTPTDDGTDTPTDDGTDTPTDDGTDSEATDNEETDTDDVDTDTTSSAVDTEDDDDTTTKTMTLATTGSEIISILVIMGFVLFALFIAKLGLTNRKHN